MRLTQRLVLELHTNQFNKMKELINQQNQILEQFRSETNKSKKDKLWEELQDIAHQIFNKQREDISPLS